MNEVNEASPANDSERTLSDLLGCPFCGSNDLFAERKDLSEAVIVCNDCGVFGPGGCPEDDDDLAAEEAGYLLPGELMARRRWNARAT